MSISLICVLLLLCNVVKSDYQEMLSLTRSSVALLDDNLFEYYIVNRTRDYDLLLLFSYTSDDSRCPTCLKTNDAFLRVAQEWGREQIKSPRLIFAVMEMQSDPMLADVFELESVPSLVYLSESHDVSNIIDEDGDSKVLEGEGGYFSEDRIIQFLKQCTGIEIKMVENNQLALLFVLIVIVVVVGLGYNYLFNYESLMDFLGGKERLLSICHFVIVITISGIMYDILRGAPAFSKGRSGGISIFARRGATITEGLLYGVLMFLAEKQILKLLDYKEKGEAEGAAEGEAKGEAEGDTEDDLYLSLFYFVGIFSLVSLFFALKMPWYFSMFKKTFF